MNLILSLLAGVVGSALGAVARLGVETADRGSAPGEAEPVAINASLTAAAAGGILGSLLGGPGRAFWLAAVLSAAGAERLDRKLLGRAGVDYSGLVDRAMEAARQARSAAEEAIDGSRTATAEAPAATTTGAAGQDA
jgi:hypothetical protein